MLAEPLRKLRRPGATPALLESELHALQQMDIPCFGARADETALQLPTGKRIESFFDRTAIDETRSRIASLNQEDLAVQVELIRMALNSRAAVGLRPPFSDPIPARAAHAAHHDCSAKLPVSVDLESFRKAARQEATRIAAELARRAVKKEGETLGWIGISYNPWLRCQVSGPIPPTFFSGAAGLAFFLAAVDHLTSTSYRGLALEAVEPIRGVAHLVGCKKQVVEDAIRFHWSGQLGIAEGLAGGIYALTHLATLLDAPELTHDAARLALHVTVERARSCDFSLLNGISGIVLGLLALHRRQPDERLVAQAVELGSLLLEAEVSELDAVGVAFGASGIALALLRIYRVTGESRWLAAAQSALTMDADRLQAAAPEDFSWAEGLSGLALVQQEEPGLHLERSGLADAVERVRTNIWSDGDSLCSGAMGRAGLLAAAGYFDESRGIGLAVLDRARNSGHYRLGWGEGCLHVGLFQGVTGVAYQMLRLAYPSELPSVLAWE